MEKAAAKFLGSYEAINGGLEESAFSIFLGTPYQSYHHEDYSANNLWSLIQEGESRNAMITTGSHFASGGDRETNRDGIPYTHAFTVLLSMTLSDGTKLLKIRNPWNIEFYKGVWSDTSRKWNRKISEEIPHT